jgi:hypothetical protein
LIDPDDEAPGMNEIAYPVSPSPTLGVRKRPAHPITSTPLRIIAAAAVFLGYTGTASVTSLESQTGFAELRRLVA